MSVIPDSDFGARVRTKLDEQIVAWLTTVSADGTPQPNPVWFLWEAETDSLIVHSANDAKRLEHIAVRPRVSLNFDGNGEGGDIVVLAGVAEQALDVAPPHQHPAYLAKYAPWIERLGMDPSSFSDKYSVPVRVRVTKVRGF